MGSLKRSEQIEGLTACRVQLSKDKQMPSNLMLEAKMHYKMHKAKKNWVYIAVTFTMLSSGLIMARTAAIHADTTSVKDSVDEQADSASLADTDAVTLTTNTALTTSDTASTEAQTGTTTAVTATDTSATDVTTGTEASQPTSATTSDATTGTSTAVVTSQTPTPSIAYKSATVKAETSTASSSVVYTAGIADITSNGESTVTMPQALKDAAAAGTVKIILNGNQYEIMPTTVETTDLSTIFPTVALTDPTNAANMAVLLEFMKRQLITFNGATVGISGGAMKYPFITGGSMQINSGTGTSTTALDGTDVMAIIGGNINWNTNGGVDFTAGQKYVFIGDDTTGNGIYGTGAIDWVLTNRLLAGQYVYNNSLNASLFQELYTAYQQIAQYYAALAQNTTAVTTQYGGLNLDFNTASFDSNTNSWVFNINSDSLPANSFSYMLFSNSDKYQAGQKIVFEVNGTAAFTFPSASAINGMPAGAETNLYIVSTDTDITVSNASLLDTVGVYVLAPDAAVTRTDSNFRGAVENYNAAVTIDTTTFPNSASTTTATIEYVDETTNTVLYVQTLTGLSGTAIGYSTADKLAEYQALGYTIESDGYPSDAVYTTDSTQTYTIQLRHTMKTGQLNVPESNLTETLTYTVTYVTSDGSLAPAAVAGEIVFTRDAISEDMVTGQINYTDWAAKGADNVIAAKTSLPTLAGYTRSVDATPQLTVTVAQDGVMTLTDEAGATTTVVADSQGNFAANYVVTYTPKAQTAVVQYVDDTTGQLIEVSDTLSGVTNAKIDYSTANVIKTLAAKNYVLSGDGFTTGTTQYFDTDEQVEQVFQVHFTHAQTSDPTVLATHGVTDSELNQVFTRTITYTTSDGTLTAAQLPATQSSTITFTRTAWYDEVTGIVSYSTWQAVNQVASFTDSQTTPITGYTADKEAVPGGTVTYNTVTDQFQLTPSQSSASVLVGLDAITQFLTVTVTLTASAQVATINFVDLDDQSTVLQTLSMTGIVNEKLSATANYELIDTTMAKLAAAHYLEAGRTFATDSVFNTTDSQTYTVSLKHDTTAVADNRAVTGTVSYQYTDGSTAAPTVSDVVYFTRTATTDWVTGITTYSDWLTTDENYLVASGDNLFSEKASPVIDGYTASIADATAVAVTLDEQGKPHLTDAAGNSVELNLVVNYTPNMQKAVIKFYDATAGTNLDQNTLPVDGITGMAFATTGVLAAVSAELEQALAAYNVDSKSLKKLQEGTFDSADATDQEFTIILTHKLVALTAQTDATTLADYGVTQQQFLQSVSGTVSYQFESGTSAAAADIRTVTFSQEANYDLVTKSVIFTGNWKAVGSDSAATLADIVPQSIAGYTAAVSVIPGGTVTVDATGTLVLTTTAGTNITGIDQINDYLTQIVIYHANTQKAAVTVIDDTLNQTLKTIYLTGVTNGEIDQSQLNNALATYFDDGYKVVARDLGAAAVFDTDDTSDQAFTVHLAHQTVTTTEAKTVTGIVHYEVPETANTVLTDSSKAINLTRSVTTDQVTKVAVATAWVLATGAAEITYLPDTAPTLAGYSITSAPMSGIITDDGTGQLSMTWTDQTVTPLINDSFSQTVAYTANAQVIHVNFYDDTLNEALAGEVAVHGATNTTLASGNATDLADVQAFIDQYQQQNYVQVNTDWAQAYFNADDVIEQAVTIHFTHQLDALTGNSDSETLAQYGVEAADFTLTVSRTIRYVDDAGTAVAPDLTDAVDYDRVSTGDVTYSRTATLDQVTNTIKFGSWEAIGGHAEFAVLTNPTIAGYTPDIATITGGTIALTTSADGQTTTVTIIQADGMARTLVATAKNNFAYEQTVTYSADEQTATVTFIDDTTGVTLTTITDIQGPSNTPIPTTQVAAQIATYGDQGYQLLSDSLGNGTLFDLDSATDQVFTVHLTHTTTSEVETQTVTRTVHYETADGESLAPDATATVTLTRTKTIDAVTQAVTSSAWVADRCWDDVASPVIAGYQTTTTTLTGGEVSLVANTEDETKWTVQLAGSALTVTTTGINEYDYEQTVTYTADMQHAVFVMVDDTTGTTLSKYQLTTAGPTAGLIYDNVQNAVTAELDALAALGYQTVTNVAAYLAGQTFDNDQTQDQFFTLHLTHQLVAVNRDNAGAYQEDASEFTKTIMAVVNYCYEDGTTATATTQEALEFVRTGVKDLVTNAVSYNAWTLASGTAELPTITVPTIAGYTADPDVLTGGTLTLDSETTATLTAPDGTVTAITLENEQYIVNVVYRPKVQQAVVTFVDTDDGSRVLQTVKLSGNTGSYIPQAALAAIEAGYLSGGYVEATRDLAAMTTFDTVDDQEQVFTIYLKHGTTTTPETKLVTGQISYQYPDGSQAADRVEDSVTFTRNKTTDLVTQAVTTTAWVAENGDDLMSEKVSPVIAGYTADLLDAVEVRIVLDEAGNATFYSVANPDQAITADLTVTYKPNPQKVTINLMDDTVSNSVPLMAITMTEASADHLSATAIEALRKDIETVEKLGYVSQTDLESMLTEMKDFQFDTDDAVDQIINLHFREKLPDNVESTTLTWTVTYQYNDGTPAAPAVERVIQVLKTTKDEKVTYTLSGADDDGTVTVGAVDSPTIAGYTVDLSSASGGTLTIDSQTGQISLTTATGIITGDDQINQTVTYTAGQQTATVTFVDDNKSAQDLTAYNKSIEGYTNAVIDQTDVTTALQKLLDRGYRVVSDNLGVGATFNATNNSYIIHLDHVQVITNETQTITGTVMYQVPGGINQVPDAVTELTVTRQVTTDNVTKETTATDWTPIYTPNTPPTIAGYTATTPKAGTVVTAKDGTLTIQWADNTQTPISDGQFSQTVTYEANPQTIMVSFYDDNLGQAVGTPLTVTGLTDQLLSEGDPAVLAQINTAIQDYEAGNYTIVNPDWGTTTFDAADGIQAAVIHLKHNYATLTADSDADQLAALGLTATDFERTVVRTIYYQYEDGTSAASEVVDSVAFSRTGVDDLTFTRTATVDQITGAVVFSAWQTLSGADTLAQRVSPEITGYTADQAVVVSAQIDLVTDESETYLTINGTRRTDVTADNGVYQWTKTVTYTPNPAVVVINFVDNGMTIGELTLSGVTGATIDQSQIEDELRTKYASYNQGQTDIPTQATYDAVPDIIEDALVGTTQIYTVTLTHQLTTTTETNSITRTIHYVDQAGTSLAEDVLETITGTRVVTTDVVTDTKIATDWTYDASGFSEVKSPEIAGYTPNTTTVAATSQFEDVKDVTVVYSQQSYHLTFEFIDDDDATNSSLERFDFTTAGVGGESITAETLAKATAELSVLEALGYQAKSDVVAFLSGTTFGTMDQVAEIHLRHQIVSLNADNAADYEQFGVVPARFTKSVYAVVNYQYVDQSPAATTNTVQLDFVRTGTLDLVAAHQAFGTGTVYGAWKAVNGTAYLPAIELPTIVGYTATIDGAPDLSGGPVTLDAEGNLIVGQSAQSVTLNDQNQYVVTVTYTADTQTATVQFIDDDTGTTLTSIKLAGQTGEVISQTEYEKRLDDFKEANYVVVNSDFVVGVTFDPATTSDQVFTTHLRHATTTVSKTKTVMGHIKYQYLDGSQAAASVEDSVTFTRDETTDSVTKTVTFTDWVAVDGDDLMSEKVSPVIAGYTADLLDAVEVRVVLDGAGKATFYSVDQPDQAIDADLTVTYTPDQQTAVISVMDDTEHTLLTQETLTGATQTAIPQKGLTAVIAGYTALGYDLVTSDLTAEAVFDSDTTQQQTFTVHLVHHITTTIEATEVTRTVKFVDAKQLETEVAQSQVNIVKFIRNKVVDEALASNGQDGATTYTDWQLVNTDETISDTGILPAVTVPTVVGYHVANSDFTTEKLTVQLTTADADHPQIVITDQNQQVQTIDGTAFTQLVEYVADSQTATFEIYDDDDQTTTVPMDVVTVTGDTGTEINYATVAEKLASYSNYKVAANEFGAGAVFAATGGQVFAIHLQHQTSTSLEPAIKTFTTKYETTAGTTVAPDSVATINFTRQVTTDLVTNKFLATTDWTAVSGATSYTATAPELAGYTSTPVQTATFEDQAGNLVIYWTGEGETLLADNEDTQVVVYQPNTQYVDVVFVDDTTNQVLTTTVIPGVSDGLIALTGVNQQLTDYVAAGYEVVSDDLIMGMRFDSNDGTRQTFSIHLKHATGEPEENATVLTRTITRQVNYHHPMGAVTTETQTVTFVRTAIEDLVTKTITYSDWQDVNDVSQFSETESPVVDGYTGETLAGATVTVDTAGEITVIMATNNVTYDTVHLVGQGGAQVPVPTTPGIETTVDTETGTIIYDVTYTANQQTATIVYFDDTANQILATDTVTGYSNQAIDYSTAAMIKKLVAQNYEVVNDGFTAAGSSVTYDVESATDQVFTVHLKHRITKLTYDNPGSLSQAALLQIRIEVVHYQYEDGTAISDVLDTVRFIRSATYDEVTHDVMYSTWSSEDGDVTLTAKKTPIINGYLPSADQVEQITVHLTTDGDVTTHYLNSDGEPIEASVGASDTIAYTISYRPIQVTLNFYDETTNTLLSSSTVDAGTDAETVLQQIQTDLQDQFKNYTVIQNEADEDLADGTAVTADQTFGIYLQHQHDIKTPAQSGVTSQLVVHYTGAGEQTPADVVQTIHWTVDTDKVTQQTSYIPENNYKSVLTPVVTGYTASRLSVLPANLMTTMQLPVDQVVSITYTADQQTIVIGYVDEQGKLVKQDTVQGLTNTPVYYTPIVPAGFDLVNYELPSYFERTGSQSIVVMVKQQQIQLKNNGMKQVTETKGTPSAPTTVDDNRKQSTADQTLPQTNEQGSRWLSLMGLLFMGLTLGLGRLKKPK